MPERYNCGRVGVGRPVRRGRDMRAMAVTMSVAFACVARAVLGGEVTTDATDFVVEGARVTDVAHFISRAFQTPVCAEEKMWLARSDDADPRPGRPTPDQCPRYTLKVAGATAEAVLDKVCELDPDYSWQRCAHTGILNVYPTHGTALGWDAGPIVVEDKTILQVLLDEDILHLRTHSIFFDTGGGNPSWLDSRVSLDMTGAPARLVLNRLCSQLRPRMIWELSVVGRSGFEYLLTFRKMPPAAPTARGRYERVFVPQHPETNDGQAAEPDMAVGQDAHSFEPARVPPLATILPESRVSPAWLVAVIVLACASGLVVWLVFRHRRE
jgi:hypothetical protein